MLVLTRRLGEKLVIGNEVTVEVLTISGEMVRLGITAPRETSVHRYEIFAEIQAANKAASSSAPGDHSLADLAARLRERESEKADEQS